MPVIDYISLVIQDGQYCPFHRSLGHSAASSWHGSPTSSCPGIHLTREQSEQ